MLQNALGVDKKTIIKTSFNPRALSEVKSKSSPKNGRIQGTMSVSMVLMICKCNFVKYLCQVHRFHWQKVETLFEREFFLMYLVSCQTCNLYNFFCKRLSLSSCQLQILTKAHNKVPLVKYSFLVLIYYKVTFPFRPTRRSLVSLSLDG